MSDCKGPQVEYWGLNIVHQGLVEHHMMNELKFDVPALQCCNPLCNRNKDRAAAHQGRAMSKQLKVEGVILCLDIEGGFGGSSRSLFEALNYIDRDSVTPVVWCRKEGPLARGYTELDICGGLEFSGFASGSEHHGMYSG